MDLKNLFRTRMAMIHQVEISECGLACLAMISGHHGQVVTLTELHKSGYGSARGTNLDNLIQMAAGLNFTSRALRVGLSELDKLKLPAILHWDFNHFVVVNQVNRSSIQVYNPALGVRRYSRQELGDHFTGVALELAPGSAFNRKSPGKEIRLRHFIANIQGLKKILLQIISFSFLIQVIALATPFYIQLVVDEVLVRQDFELLEVLVIGFLILTLVSCLTTWLRSFSELHLTQQLSFLLGSGMFHHLLRLPCDYFFKRHLGDIQSRFGSLRDIQAFITRSALTVTLDGTMAVVTLGVIYLYSPLLASITLISFCGYTGIRLLVYAPLRRSNLEAVTHQARQETIFMESVRAIRSIKLFGMETQRENGWQNSFTETINAQYKTGKLSITSEMVSSILTGSTSTIIVFLGAQQVIGGAMTIGGLYAFIAYQRHFNDAMIKLINQFLDYLMIRVHLERLSDISQAETEPGIDSGFIQPIDGALTAEAITFSYSAMEPPVIRNLDLTIPAGATVAIVGPSGAGKSTLISILCGLTSPTEGRLLVDGIPLSRMGISSYRRNIGAVMQNDTLLAGSIGQNICFHDLSPNQDRIQEAARWAHIHADILQMPMGYDTQIGDMGSALSQGQQQRLLIARALYTRPAILLMDEGTAHLDAAAEEVIMNNVHELGVTCIFISHRQTLLTRADLVVQINAGKISITRNLPNDSDSAAHL